MEEYGYIRVSSTDQNEERQRVALKSQGIAEANIYMDKMSGKNFDRPGYKKSGTQDAFWGLFIHQKYG